MNSAKMASMEQRKIKDLPDYLKLTHTIEQVSKIRKFFNLEDSEYSAFFYKPVIDSSSHTYEIWGIYGTIPDPEKTAYKII